MAEVSAINSTNTLQQCDMLIMPVKAASVDASVWTNECQLVEAVAKYIPKNPDGTLNVKAAKELTILDLLLHATTTLSAMVEAKNPEEKKRLENEYHAFDNLLQKREEDEMKKRPSENILDLQNVPQKRQ